MNEPNLPFRKCDLLQGKVGDRMPFISPEAITEARNMDLLTYMQNYEPSELVHLSGNTYTTRSHDSLKISNGKWMWWSRGFGGYTALDYLVKVKGMSFVEAVETIIGRSAIVPPIYAEAKKNDTVKKLLLPDKSASNYQIIRYLCGRGIDRGIVEDCIKRGVLFESLPYHNAVFVGFDEKKEPKFAAYRATNDQRIMGDCCGSDKNYSFRLADNDNPEIHLFECAIDLLSYATLCKKDGIDYRELNLISLAGVYMPKEKIEDSTVPMALLGYLEKHPTVQKIVIHFDNDTAGRRASAALQILIKDKYTVVDEPPKYGKDVNDYLNLRTLYNRKTYYERNEER